MLILSRRVGETLIVGSDVVVRVLGVKGRQVRIGVTAPEDIVVRREEVYERTKGRQSEGDLKDHTDVAITLGLASPAAFV